MKSSSLLRAIRGVPERHPALDAGDQRVEQRSRERRDHDCRPHHVDLEPADLIFVNAGSTRPSLKWLDALSPKGRLLFPLITTQVVQLKNVFGHRNGKPKRSNESFKGQMVGMMIGVRRVGAGYAACGVSSVGIFPCVSAIDRDEDREAARVLESRNFEDLKSLRRDPHSADPTCWLHGREVCFSSREAADRS